MPWITLRLRVTTPLFNGDDDVPLRVSSLRGAMRYWFRALAGSRVGPDIRVLRRLENTVFGSTEDPAPVRMRLTGLPTVRRNPHPSFLDKQEEPGIGYLMGQGLGSFTGGGYRILRPYVPPENSQFALELALPNTDGDRSERSGDEQSPHPDESVVALTLASLWMVCAYGGVGARVRRGFGGLSIIKVEPHGHVLPAPWTDPELLRSPGLDHYRALDRLQRLQPIGPLETCLPHVDSLLTHLGVADAARPWREDETPTYPVFSSTRTCAGLSACSADHWDELLAHVGRQYRLSRATSDNSASRTNYRPKVKTPERDAVLRGGSDRFPLGALGLPVVYSKDRVTVGERRASPLWLRPVRGDEGWRLFSFAFHNTFLPEGTEVKLNGLGGRSVAVTDDDVVQRTGDWVRRMRTDPAPYRLPWEEARAEAWSGT